MLCLCVMQLCYYYICAKMLSCRVPISPLLKSMQKTHELPHNAMGNATNNDIIFPQLLCLQCFFLCSNSGHFILPHSIMIIKSSSYGLFRQLFLPFTHSYEMTHRQPPSYPHHHAFTSSFYNQLFFRSSSILFHRRPQKDDIFCYLSVASSR